MAKFNPGRQAASREQQEAADWLKYQSENGMLTDELPTMGDMAIADAMPDVYEAANLVAPTEVQQSVEEQDARATLASTPSTGLELQQTQHDQAIAKISQQPNNNPNAAGQMYSGFNNNMDPDLNRQNVEEFSGYMQEGNTEAASNMIPVGDDVGSFGKDKNEAIVASQSQLSSLVQNQFGFLSTGFSSSVAQELVGRTAEDLKMDPKSVAEYLNSVLSDNKTLTDRGLDQVLSDTGIAAVFQIMLDNKYAQVNRNIKMKNGTFDADGSNDSQNEHQASMAMDEQIGGVIERSFGKQDSTPATRSIMGGLMKRIVFDALGGFEVDGAEGLEAGGFSSFDPSLASKEGGTIINASGQSRSVSPEGVVKAGFFHGKKIKQENGDDLWVYELTPKGEARALQLQPLSQILLPDLKKDVNATPPIGKDGNPLNSAARQRRQDKNRMATDGKRYTDTQKGITALEHTGNAIETVYGVQLMASLQNPDVMAILMKEDDYVNLIGLELGNGQVIRVDQNGGAFAQEWRLDSNGNKIPNPRFDPTQPGAELEFETQPLMGDKAKMINFQQDLQWLQDHAADTAFYYTYSIGGSKRVHVEQTIGNYQMSTLVRSLLKAPVDRQYDVNNKADVITFQAGILKKLGMNKAKEGSNKQLSDRFNGMAREWANIQKNFLEGGGQGFAPILVEQAAGKERDGWMSLSAISEAIEFHNFKVTAKNPSKPQTYNSGFITEIDGLANGLAINSMQAGDLRVAKLTGMVPMDKDDEYSLQDNDVYTITTEQFKASVDGYAGKDLSHKFQQAWDSIIESNFSGHDGRGLSKGSLMIFGYGAGDVVVGDKFITYLEEKLTGSEELSNMNDKEKAQFFKLSGKIMIDSVKTNFPAMQELSSVLSAITSYAVSLGIDPHTVTDNYDLIEMGLSGRVADETSKMTSSFKGANSKGKKNRGRPGRLEIQSMMRKLDSLGVELTNKDGVKIKTTFKNGVHSLAQLKAAKQAPVLITQAMDSLIMMRAIANLRAKSGDSPGFFAAQIYDGMLMTPKDAQEYADALHKEIVHISQNYSSIDSLIESIKALDVKRFEAMALAIEAKKQGVELSDKQAAAIISNPMKFVLGAVPFKNKKGEGILTVLSRLERNRAEVLKRIDLKKTNQYQYNWPTKK